MEYSEMERFMDIIRMLRSENGCPWDREQTHESLIPCIREECYEVIDAIHRNDVDNLKEELGDVLLQVALHTAIAEEKNEFSLNEVIEGVREKMIRRHPHVFGDVMADNSSQVLHNWEEIKKLENKEKRASEGIQKIARALPANIRAEKVQKKAAKVGLDFETYEQVLEKVYEELEELKIAKIANDKKQIDEEFGDLMFSIVNLSRFLKLNAENSLTNAIDKFINRFVGIEHLAEREGKSLNDMSIDELNALWGQLKKSE